MKLKLKLRHLFFCAAGCVAVPANAAPAANAVTAAKPTAAELRASAILRDVEKASRNYRTLTANFEVLELGNVSYKGSLRAMKPHYFWASYKHADIPKSKVENIVNDGKYRWATSFLLHGNKYMRMKLNAGETFVGISQADIAIEIFLDMRRWLSTYSLSQRFKFVGTEKMAGLNYRVLMHQELQPGWEKKKFRAITILFVSHDNVIHRVIRRIHDVVDGKTMGNGSFDDFRLLNVKLNVPMTSAQFKWKPPAGAIEHK